MRVGVLLVGTGFVADQHLAALDATPKAELAGVVDVDPVRARRVGRAHGGARWTTDLQQALTWPEVDACIVCTPNDTHARIGEQVAAAGKHLLMEKPLAITAAGAAGVAGSFSERGLELSVAHTHRFYDYGRAVHDAISDGLVGTPRFVRLAILGGWIWGDWEQWVLDPRRSGGHALHNGTHLLDLVAWWVGDEPATVLASGRKATAAELDIYDYLEMIVTFAGGATAVCEISRAHRPSDLAYRDVLVIGTEDMLSLPWDADRTLVFDERGATHDAIASANGFAAQLDAWLGQLPAPSAAPRREPGIGAAGGATGDDGVRAVVAALAAERSLASGQPVRLAEVTEGAPA